MARQEPITPTTCDHCGKPFNTSQQHPRRYCSIACEEGRAPLPMSDPQSPGHAQFLQGKPSALVGRNIIAIGLKRVDYSPDWAKGPHYTNRESTVWVDAVEQVYVREADVFLGKVVEYDGNEYTIEHENPDTGEKISMNVSASVTLEQIQEDRWWVE